MPKLTVAALCGSLFLAMGCGGGSSSRPSNNFALTVTLLGTGSGTVTSSPSGINCPTTCTANFTSGTAVTLTAAVASGGTFLGWTSPCSGTGSCSVTLNAAQSVTATFNGPTTGANVQPITVDGGPVRIIDLAFTSVTVCAPGSTSNCQTIPGVLVDTGSYGLRVVSSVLTVSLNQETDSITGQPIAECAQFANGVAWGPVKIADVKIGGPGGAGEVASSIPIHVIGDPAFSNVPAACKNASPGGVQDTVPTLGANGIIGVGAFMQDCGPACAPGTTNNPGFYYTCSSPSNCTVATSGIGLAQQLQNPVSKFATDNNGVIVELLSPGAGGAPTVNGLLVFGIGTQSNNGLGAANVFTLNATADFTTMFNGQSYSRSFIDSGSNGVFFPGSGVSGLTTCPASTQFYCPAATLNLQATNSGANGTSSPLNFSVANLDAFPGNDAALPDVAGPFSFTSSSFPTAFDWGTPFFFGRNVYIAIESTTAPGGTTPYWAY